ncbi:MAG: hypothetical protein NT062_36035 [Proteobacteria bacterium]|nr:hypothetical protein [Pseudomonadota bacterium]
MPPRVQQMPAGESVMALGSALGLAMAHGAIGGSDDRSAAVGRLIYELTEILASSGMKPEAAALVVRLVCAVSAGGSRYLQTPTTKAK